MLRNVVLLLFACLTKKLSADFSEILWDRNKLEYAHTHIYIHANQGSPGKWPLKWRERSRNFRDIYTVSTKKVTHCIHCHNSDKQCQILTEFWISNAMPNCKQITKFK